MNIILYSFGIIYAWVKLANRGAQIGGGAGLVIGAVCGSLLFMSTIGWFPGAVIGLIGGNLIGGGLYEWNQELHERNRVNERIREYQEFIVHQFGQDRQAVATAPLFHVAANRQGDVELDVP